MAESLFADGRLREPLPSRLRTPEQMEWINDRFTIDGLARLARSTPDYFLSKGYYLPDVAALAHAALAALDAATTELAEQRATLPGLHTRGSAAPEDVA